MDIDVASARMTKRGDSSDYDFTASGKATKQHCEWLRPRGLEGCIIQVPPVVTRRHSKVVVRRQ